MICQVYLSSGSCKCVQKGHSETLSVNMYFLRSVQISQEYRRHNCSQLSFDKLLRQFWSKYWGKKAFPEKKHVLYFIKKNPSAAVWCIYYIYLQITLRLKTASRLLEASRQACWIHLKAFQCGIYKCTGFCTWLSCSQQTGRWSKTLKQQLLITENCYKHQM